MFLGLGSVIRFAAGDYVLRVSLDFDSDAPLLSIARLVCRIVADDVAQVQVCKDAVVNSRRL